MSPSPDRPLNDVERDRMNAILSRFHSEDAMNNAEEVDGFFAALICSPEIAKPNEYLAEIWGEMTDDEAFAGEQEFQEFLRLLMRHWNSIGRKLEEDDVFTPLLFEDEAGTAHGNGGFRTPAVETLTSLESREVENLARQPVRSQHRSE